MINTGEDRNFPRFRRGANLPLEELRRMNELARSMERATATGDAGVVAQTGAGGFAINWDSTPGYLGFAALIIGQDPFNPYMYQFRPLIEQPFLPNANTPAWIADNNFFLYPDQTYNAMEANFRVDVPWDRQPFITISNAATGSFTNDTLIVGDATTGFLNPTGNLTAGSQAILSISSTWGLQVGQSISDIQGLIPANTTITRVSELGAVAWLVPNAVPDFFTFYYFERVMVVEITGPLITDNTQPGFGYYPAIEKIWNTAARQWSTGDTIYFRDANM